MISARLVFRALSFVKKYYQKNPWLVPIKPVNIEYEFKRLDIMFRMMVYRTPCQLHALEYLQAIRAAKRLKTQ